MSTKSSEIGKRADFSYIRYSQCWEDTRVVLDALDVQEDDLCVSIASAGDNSLALLTGNPGKVISLDLNACQLALVDLKIRAMEKLEREEVLLLLGYISCGSGKRKETIACRLKLFTKLAPYLKKETLDYFHENKALIENGLAGCGKFEKYFKIFRTCVLPLVHSKKTVEELVAEKNYEERLEFYHERWNTTRWQLLFKIFFSNKVMGLLGRDPQFFKYATQSLPEFLQGSVYNALVNEDPSKNPYLHWILFGEYRDVLPFWLEEENYSKIKNNIDRIEIRKQSLEEFLEECPSGSVDCWNLSDIFEYMSEANFRTLLERIARKSGSGARLAYWNMLVPRSVKGSYGITKIRRDEVRSAKLYAASQTFFYTRFNLEVIGQC